MESAPLIKAHDHARAASDATHASNSTVAINEHTRAAGEFANAARSTTSVEALRTLKLLEEHHRRLSELLTLPHGRPATHVAGQDESQAADEKGDAAPSPGPVGAAAKSDQDAAASSEKSPQALPKLPRQQAYPARDLGASIANNLASARGIRSKHRSQPLSPSVSNAEAPGNLSARRGESGPKSKMQNVLENADNRPNATASAGASSRRSRAEQHSGGRDDGSASPDKAPESEASANDEGFSRFYSVFGNMINKISAPLAFAGLPLTLEERAEAPAPEPAPEPDPAQKRSRRKTSSASSTEPNLNKIYSKAALKAISRDGQVNDSFYVVPTSGHTVSYASILSFADKERRRMEASHGSLAEDPDADDFVDARESQGPSSNHHHHHANTKRRSGKTRSEKDLVNMVEELSTENQSLKDMIDKISKRLHAFELTSQNSGMRLAESVRLARPDDSPLSSATAAAAVSRQQQQRQRPGDGGGGGGGDDEILRKRNQELEEQVLLYAKQMDELTRDHNKARANLVRYREKWEQLKAGAKARRAGGGSSSGAQTASLDVAAAAAADRPASPPALG